MHVNLSCASPMALGLFGPVRGTWASSGLLGSEEGVTSAPSSGVFGGGMAEICVKVN